MRHRHKQRVLFITKLRSGYSGYGHLASGLKNSAQFVVDMLNGLGIESKLVSVVDNNSIDKEVHDFRPTVCIVEALWVVPEKFDVLVKLHPRVVWIVRGHSDIPFLANEGIAIEWVKRYVAHKNVYVGWNDKDAVRSLQAVVGCHEKILYLPNYYPVQPLRHRGHENGRLNVGCFGAIRPMKNQLLQAVAAVRFANKHGHKLDFHINGTRCEQGGQSVLKNLRALFANTEHRLIEHGWLNRQEFLRLLQTMDYALAVSFSETFCIVAADAVTAGVPLICSDQVPWAAEGSIVPTTSADAIVRKMNDLRSFCARAWNRFQNRIRLARFSRESKHVWKNLLLG